MITWDAYPGRPGELEYDDETYLYTPESGAPPRRVARLAFDPTGQYLATMPAPADRDPAAYPLATVWRPDGTRVRDIPGGGPTVAPTAIAFGPDGTWLAVADQVLTHDMPRTLRLWDVATGGVRAERPAKTHVYDLATLPDGGLLAAADGLWRHPPGLAADPTRLPNAGDAVRVAVAGEQVAAASKTGASVWDAAGKRVAYRGHKKGPQNGPVAFRPHSTVLAVGHGTVVDLWDFASGAEVVLKGHKRSVWAVGFWPDGTAYTAASDGAVIAWDADTGAVREKFDFGTGKLYSAAVSPDGLTLALGGDDGRVTVVDLDG